MSARQQGCTSACEHVNDGPWPHDVKLEEDTGVIHTDDCDFFSKDAAVGDRDPGDFCTAGFPGITCRVFSRAADMPAPGPRPTPPEGE